MSHVSDIGGCRASEGRGVRPPGKDTWGYLYLMW